MGRRKIDLSDYDWWCDNCGAALHEQPGFDATRSGYWTCECCGHENLIAESEIIDDFYEDNDSFYEDSDEEDDIPEGCTACGNPAYPNCKLSCPIFDD